MIQKLNHIGIAVRDLEAAIQVYEAGLGVQCGRTEIVEDQQVKAAFLAVGETNLELLESLNPEGPIGRYIEKRGEGIHHLCFEVEDISAALARCKRAGLRLIDTEPRLGAHNMLVAFVHPKSTHGVLIELSQQRRD